MIVIILGVGGQTLVTADFVIAVIAVIAVAIAVIVITVLHKLFQILSCKIKLRQ